MPKMNSGKRFFYRKVLYMEYSDLYQEKDL